MTYILKKNSKLILWVNFIPLYSSNIWFIVQVVGSESNNSLGCVTAMKTTTTTLTTTFRSKLCRIAMLMFSESLISSWNMKQIIKETLSWLDLLWDKERQKKSWRQQLLRHPQDWNQKANGSSNANNNNSSNNTISQQQSHHRLKMPWMSWWRFWLKLSILAYLSMKNKSKRKHSNLLQMKFSSSQA